MSPHVAPVAQKHILKNAGPNPRPPFKGSNPLWNGPKGDKNLPLWQKALANRSGKKKIQRNLVGPLSGKWQPYETSGLIGCHLKTLIVFQTC